MNLEEAFSPRTLAKTVELYRDHAAKAQKLQGLFREDSSDVSGDLVEWDEIQYPRGLAPFVDGDSPSIRKKQLKKTKRSTTIAHVKLNKHMGGRKLFITENAPGELQPNASAVIAREIADMVNCVLRTKEWMASKAFTGSIVINDTNVEDSELAFTVTYAVSTFTPTTSWALAATAVISSTDELPSLKGSYSDDTGEEIERLIFNRSVETALLGNTEIKDWAAKTDRGVSIMELGRIQTAGGISWEKYDKSYKPTGGAITPFIANGYAICLPGASVYGEYLVYAVGQGLIPKSAIGATSDGLVGIAPPGIYQYAMLTDEPVGVKLFVGWSGFPIIKYPNIVVYANCFGGAQS